MSQMQQRQQNTGQQAALQQLGRAAEQQRQWTSGTHQTIGLLWPQVQEIGVQQMRMQNEQQQVKVQMQHQMHQQMQQQLQAQAQMHIEQQRLMEVELSILKQEVARHSRWSSAKTSGA